MAADLNRVRDNWIMGLMQKGLIVKLSMTRWRGFSPLTHEDLGIKFSNEESYDFSTKYLSYGEHRLLPQSVTSRFEIIERTARSLLKSFSFITPWGCFVPEHSLGQWEERIEVIKQEYFDAARLFGDNYDLIVSEVKKEYRGFARDVWSRLYPENKDGATPAFVEHFSQRMADKIPPREEIVSSFNLSYVYLEIPIPSLVQENIVKADELKRANDLAKEDHKTVISTKKKIADIYAKRREELMIKFLDSTVLELRRNVAEICEAILVTMGRATRTDTVVPLNVKKKIRKIITETRRLNFYDDKKIDEMMNDLDVEVGKMKGEENNEIIEDRLKKIVDLAKKEIDFNDFNPTLEYLEI